MRGLDEEDFVAVVYSAKEMAVAGERRVVKGIWEASKTVQRPIYRLFVLLSLVKSMGVRGHKEHKESDHHLYNDRRCLDVYSFPYHQTPPLQALELESLRPSQLMVAEGVVELQEEVV